MVVAWFAKKEAKEEHTEEYTSAALLRCPEIYVLGVVTHFSLSRWLGQVLGALALQWGAVVRT